MNFGEGVCWLLGQSNQVTSDGTAWLDAQSISAIVILTLAALVQSTVGFAAALFGLPLLMLAGADLMSAVVMIITAMLPQNFLSVWKLRQSIQFKEVLLPAAIRISGLPIGILGLGAVLTWKPERIDQLVGVMILLAIVLQTFVGIEWKNAKRWYWILITFGGSGVLQGLSGTSGPPMVLWVHGQRYSADHARAFLFSMFIANYVPQMLLLYAQFGHRVLWAAGTALLSVPTVLLAANIGTHLGSRLGDQRLRPLTYACLTLLALRSLLAPFFA